MPAFAFDAEYTPGLKACIKDRLKPAVKQRM